jgi:hypothetical protein
MKASAAYTAVDKENNQQQRRRAPPATTQARKNNSGTTNQNENSHHNSSSTVDKKKKPLIILPALQNRTVVVSVSNAPTTQPSNQRAVALPNLFQQQETLNPIFSPVDRSFNVGNVGRSSNSSSQKRNRPSVLRFGETVESLFQLDGMSSSEYWNVCRSITSDSHENNDKEIPLWRKILELATEHVATVEQPSSSTNTVTKLIATRGMSESIRTALAVCRDGMDRAHG